MKSNAALCEFNAKVPHRYRILHRYWKACGKAFVGTKTNKREYYVMRIVRRLTSITLDQREKKGSLR